MTLSRISRQTRRAALFLLGTLLVSTTACATRVSDAEFDRVAARAPLPSGATAGQAVAGAAGTVDSTGSDTVSSATGAAGTSAGGATVAAGADPSGTAAVGGDSGVAPSPGCTSQ
ncbi:MAG: hypothetical protein QOJ67_3222, partial [Acidimicrobiaceae bacterium]